MNTWLLAPSSYREALYSIELKPFVLLCLRWLEVLPGSVTPLAPEFYQQHYFCISSVVRQDKFASIVDAARVASAWHVLIGLPLILLDALEWQ